MNRLIIITFLFFFVTNSFCQELELDLPHDLYGMEVVFKESILVDKCDCCCSVHKPIGKCRLYKVLIQNVIFHRDSTVYLNNYEIMDVRYLVLQEDQVSIELNKLYTVFGFNSCSREILIVNQLFNRKLKLIPDYGSSAYVTGLNKCKKYNFFQKILLRLGMNREKIHQKVKEVPASNSKFVQAIKK